MTGEHTPRLERMENKLDKVVDTLTQVSVLNERLVNYINEQHRMGERVERVEEQCRLCAINDIRLDLLSKTVNTHEKKIEVLDLSRAKAMGWITGAIFIASAVAAAVSKLLGS